MWDETGVLNAMAGRGACGAFSAEQTALPVIGEAFSAEQAARPAIGGPGIFTCGLQQLSGALRLAQNCLFQARNVFFLFFGLNLVVLIPRCID